MKIKFLCEATIKGAIPSPVPALKAAPDYYKKIKPQIGDHPHDSTVKRCIPFMDAMSAGFIIPLWTDVFIRASDGNINVDFPKGLPQKYQIGSHSEAQIPNHPLSGKKYGNLALKWLNPWIIETEPGVSCLFTSPLNHLDPRIKVFDGVVDTDSYYTQVHFPFLWRGGDGEFYIPRGTPLMQVIPFRREETSMSIDVIDVEREQTTMAILTSKMKERYKTDFWHAKRNKEEVQQSQDDSLVAQSDEPHVIAEKPITTAAEMPECSDADRSPADQKIDEPVVVPNDQAEAIVEDNVVPLRDQQESIHSILEVVADDGKRGFGEGPF